MSKEVVAEVIALIELGMIAPEDIVKCLRKANSEPEKALAEQPAQQEPVAIALNTGTKQGVKWLRSVEHGKNLYTTPQPAQRKPLTLREIGAVCGNFSNETIKVVRQTERAHSIKEKNT